MKNLIDRVAKWLTLTMWLIIAGTLVEAYKDMIRYEDVVTRVIWLIIMSIMLMPAFKLLEAFINVKVNKENLEHTLKFDKWLMIVQIVNTLLIQVVHMNYTFGCSLDMLILSILLLIQFISQYIKDKQLLKIYTMQQIIELQVKLLDKGVQ